MAEIESIIGFSVKTFLSSSFFTASDSATNAPEKKNNYCYEQK